MMGRTGGGEHGRVGAPGWEPPEPSSGREGAGTRRGCGRCEASAGRAEAPGGRRALRAVNQQRGAAPGRAGRRGAGRGEAILWRAAGGAAAPRGARWEMESREGGRRGEGREEADCKSRRASRGGGAAQGGAGPQGGCGGPRRAHSSGCSRCRRRHRRSSARSRRLLLLFPPPPSPLSSSSSRSPQPPRPFPSRPREDGGPRAAGAEGPAGRASRALRRHGGRHEERECPFPLPPFLRSPPSPRAVPEGSGPAGAVPVPGAVLAAGPEP